MATKKSKRSTGKGPAKKPAAAAPGNTSPAKTTKPAPTKTAREKRHDERDRAKAAVAARQAAEKTRARLVNGVIIGLAVVLVLGLGLVIWKDANKPVVKPKAMTSDYGMLVGEASAPQKVVVYEDFLCGPCGQLEQMINSGVDDAVKTGTVSIEYRPVNQLDTGYSNKTAQAFWAVLESDGAEVAKKFHDALYADQPSETDTPDTDWILDRAEQAGADRAKVKKALDDNTYEGLVEAATDEARSTGPKDRRGGFSTPGVVINGSPVVSASLSDIGSKIMTLFTAAAPPAAVPSATASGTGPVVSGN